MIIILHLPQECNVKDAYTWFLHQMFVGIYNLYTVNYYDPSFLYDVLQSIKNLQMTSKQGIFATIIRPSKIFEDRSLAKEQHYINMIQVIKL